MDILRICLFQLVLLISIIQGAAGCSNQANCLYAMWYFWFLMFWVLFFIGMAILYCIKKKSNSSNHIHNVEPPKLTRARSPPPYSAPSHKPPEYTAHAPVGTISSVHGQMPLVDSAYPPGSIYPPPPPQHQGYYHNDPAYPPQGGAPRY